MRRFSDIELEDRKLTKDEASGAGEAVRHFDQSPAWFRLAQLLQAERKSITDILKQRPKTHCMSDYAEAAGQLYGINRLEKLLDQITTEANAANGS